MKFTFSFLLAAMLSLSMTAYAVEPLFDTPTDYSAGENPYFIFVADLDGDGDVDLATANEGLPPDSNGSVSVLLNEGNGTFAVPVEYEVGVAPEFVSGSDFNGDGKVDLAVGNTGLPYSNAGNVSILLNAGDGTFADPVNYAGGEDVRAVCCADLDGDNDVDLAVAIFDVHMVAILLNNGDGTFADAVNYGSVSRYESIYGADLDGDGDIDLALANPAVDSVTILFNSGSAVFSGAVNYGAGDAPVSVFGSDLDNDGDIDLVLGNYSSNNISVLLNQHNGVFSEAVNYDVGSYPVIVFAADLDGDSYADLAVANTASDNISVLINNGYGDFIAAGDYGAGDRPVAVFGSDVDGDGDIDLAAANSNSDDVSILLNRTIISDADDQTDEYQIRGDFALFQNYPNPFNPSTRIEYTILKREHVVVTIHNLLGQKIATLVDETEPAGQHSVIWNGRDCRGGQVASGVYFYRLQTSEIFRAKKMILLK